ncbi:MAG: hypothetical protein AAF067_12620 [Pseudomonadota bacterium]
MELVLEEILTPTGAPKTKWRESGEDIAAILASLPGGPTANALLTTGEVPTLTFFGPIPPGLMDGWQLVQAGVNSVAPADAASGGFVAIGRRHLAFSDDRATENLDNAYCTRSDVEEFASHVRVYRDERFPFDASSETDRDPEIEAMALHHILGMMGNPQVCIIYEAIDQNSFREVTYTRNGEPLGNADTDSEPSRIVQNFDFREQLTSQMTSSLFDEDVDPENEE